MPQLIRDFLASQRRWQAELGASLGAKRTRSPRNSQLVWTWDYMSLAVCLSWAPCAVADVPTAMGAGHARDASGRVGRLEAVVVDPWPFRDPGSVTVHYEGQRLTEPVDSPAALDRALAVAPWETLEVELTPEPGNDAVLTR